jgi:hypothetical protein
MTYQDSVFVLKMIYVPDKISYPATLNSETFGYFSDLKKAEYFVSYKDKEAYWFLEDYSFKIFEIEEYGLDYFFLQIRTRVYTQDGAFYEEHLAEYEKGYPGKDEDECRFKKGDLVEFIHSGNLEIGIIASLPPDPKKVKALSEKVSKETGSNRHPFDASDDSYMVLFGFNKLSHAHPNVHQVFSPSVSVPAEIEKLLIERYLK